MKRSILKQCNYYYGIDLENTNAVWNYTKVIHDQLESICQEFTFSQNEVGELALTELDIIAYAYIKEELVNTPSSPIVEYLTKNCPKLVAFVQTIDNLLTQEVILAKPIEIRCTAREFNRL